MGRGSGAAEANAARRRELAAFLRDRRARLQPAEAGLAVSSRRRTPGLRREEVAQLAHVSVSWYAWLEQARDIVVSESVLDALARTLQLSDVERRHLFVLAGRVTASAQSNKSDGGMRALTDELAETPAYMVDHNWDILHSNAGYSALIGNPTTLPPEQRNALWLVFTDPSFPRLLADWDDEAERLVGQLRIAQALHGSLDTRTRELITDLRSASDAFDQLWRSNVVHGFTPSLKAFNHEQAGRLEFNYVKLAAVETAGLRLLAFMPTNSAVRRNIKELIESGYQRVLAPLPVPVTHRDIPD